MTPSFCFSVYSFRFASFLPPTQHCGIIIHCALHSRCSCCDCRKSTDTGGISQQQCTPFLGRDVAAEMLKLPWESIMLLRSFVFIGLMNNFCFCAMTRKTKRHKIQNSTDGYVCMCKYTADILSPCEAVLMNMLTAVQLFLKRHIWRNMFGKSTCNMGSLLAPSLVSTTKLFSC